MNIYIYGNCQVTALRQMMLEQHPGWSVTAWDVAAEPTIDEPVLKRHAAMIANADIVVSQPVGNYRGEPRLSLHTLRGHLGPTTQLITFPSVVFEGTHGAFTYVQGRLPGYCMPYHNSHVIDMSLRGYQWDDACKLLDSPDFYTADFVLSGFEASLAEMRAREADHGLTIKVTALIDEMGRSRVVMNAINHPRRMLMARLLNEIYAAMSVERTATEAGEEYMPFPLIPPLPSVLHHLGIADDRPAFSDGVRSWTREAYTRASLAYYGRLDRAELVRSLDASTGRKFLGCFREELAAASRVASPLSELSAAAREAIITDAFAVLLKRPASAGEIAAHSDALQASGFQQWLQSMVESEECRRHLACAPVIPP